MTAKGRLIVCEGIDGSGKTVQSALLQERFKKEGYLAAAADFPRYGKPPEGDPASFFVRKYLQKKEFGFSLGYGPCGEVGSYAASLFYALDRFDAVFDQEHHPNLGDLLKEGYVLVSNRYTESNIGHQMAKIENPANRRKFLDWLMNLEYEILKIPRPSLVLLFNIPPATALQLKELQRRKEGLDQDGHESDTESLSKAHWAYLEAAKLLSYYWTIINVYSKEEKRLLSKEEVHELAWREVKKLLER